MFGIGAASKNNLCKQGALGALEFSHQTGVLIKFLSKRLCMLDALLCDICELKRLQILENAVIHYSDGIFTLERRALVGKFLLENNNPEVAKILADIARYLHELIEAGKLRDSPLYSADDYQKPLDSLIRG
ncbi:hypothetical protein OGW14_17440 [Citrobacter sp. Cb018]|uniref:hypothetical protein n=1 Tax=Citrobacter sp. Cb018 TaxID=2985016 RepID=UPI002579EEBF|nr:hypothetical protein [Citrobacter sp. Cb018]MDM3413281.1 hypothetical protein [Citrobacter sp. Cb018]